MTHPTRPTPWLTGRGFVAATLVAAVLVMLLLLVPLLIEDRFSANHPDRGLWLYWASLLAGNWSAQEAPVSPRTLAFSAVFAALLNNALLAVLVGLIWRYVIEWRRRMRLSQAFVARDQMNKQAVLRKLSKNPETLDPKLAAAVNEAFQEGARQWQDHLVAVFGEQEARRLMEMLERPV